MNSANQPRGFKGLPSLFTEAEVSVEKAAEPSPPKDPPREPAHAPKPEASASPVSQTNSSNSGAIIALTIVGVLIAIPILAALSQAGSSSPGGDTSVSDATAAASAADSAASAAELQAAIDASRGSTPTVDEINAESAAPYDAAASASSASVPSDYAGSSYQTDEQRPSVGTDQVLFDPQMRYCTREKIRLDGADGVVDTSDGGAVDRFNAMVDDYNSRCGAFRYQSGRLEPIQREAEGLRAQLEQEGRDRFPRAASPQPTSPTIMSAGASSVPAPDPDLTPESTPEDPVTSTEDDASNSERADPATN